MLADFAITYNLLREQANNVSTVGLINLFTTLLMSFLCKYLVTCNLFFIFYKGVPYIWIILSFLINYT